MIDEDKVQLLPDRIYENFLQTTLFVTGGTGFMGKVIIERLLRVFDVKKVYVLVRFKKDTSPKVRLAEIFTNPLFQKVRELKGAQIFEKCVAIVGDVTKDNLGLSVEDRETLKGEVEYVIHAAATVRFDEPLKSALLINTKGVFSSLQLAEEMQKLKCFAYISTTFCHPEEEVLEEKVYRSSHNPEKFIKVADWFDDNTIAAMAKTLLDKVPNTYTFSKALAEDLVADAMDTIPAIILRPSIVIPVWKEPLPGWFDNVNGPIGVLIAAGKGVLRTMYGNKDMYADIISVDAAVDGVFVYCAYSIINRFETRVYNICTNREVGLTWQGIYELSEKVFIDEVPFDLILWTPGGGMTNCKIAYYFMLVFKQLIPALLIDTLLPLFGYKPFLWRTQMRIINGLDIFRYYTSRQWMFDNGNVIIMREWLNSKESSRYAVYTQDMNYEQYMMNGILYARKFLKEPDENLPLARRRIKRMLFVDKVCGVLLKLLLAYLFYKLVVSLVINL
ncbi:hypothetical protein Trydic_g2370 [Trypoxylus dichotomus]